MKTGVLIASFLLLVTPAFAQTKSMQMPTRAAKAFVTPRVTGRPQVKPSGVATTERVAKKSAQVKTVLDKLITNYGQKLVRYEDFLTKVKNRESKLSDAGADTTKLDSFISVAETNLKNTQTVYNTTKSTLLGVTFTGDMKTTAETVRNAVRPLKESFVTLHSSMKQTVEVVRTESEKASSSENNERVRPTKTVTPMNHKNK